MGKYRILLKKSAAEELEALPKKDLRLVLKRINSLEDNPHLQGCQKLSSQKRYRVRQGDYRIAYAVSGEDLKVTVFKIGQRREVYRD
jgi:mRNA interferase RelE/StbE